MLKQTLLSRMCILATTEAIRRVEVHCYAGQHGGGVRKGPLLKAKDEVPNKKWCHAKLNVTFDHECEAREPAQTSTPQ